MSLGRRPVVAENRLPLWRLQRDPRPRSTASLRPPLNAPVLAMGRQRLPRQIGEIACWCGSRRGISHRCCGRALSGRDPRQHCVLTAPAKTSQEFIATLNGALNGAKERTPVDPLPPASIAEAPIACTPTILRTLRQGYVAVDRPWKCANSTRKRRATPAACHRPSGARL
jgi:hypothetical protein